MNITNESTESKVFGYPLRLRYRSKSSTLSAFMEYVANSWPSEGRIVFPEAVESAGPTPIPKRLLNLTAKTEVKFAVSIFETATHHDAKSLLYPAAVRRLLIMDEVVTFFRERSKTNRNPPTNSADIRRPLPRFRNECFIHRGLYFGAKRLQFLSGSSDFAFTRLHFRHLCRFPFRPFQSRFETLWPFRELHYLLG